MQRRRRIVRLAAGTAVACVACLALTWLAINAAPRVLVALLGLQRIDSLESALPPDPAPLALDASPLDHVDLLLPPHLTEPISLTSSDLGSTGIVGDRSTTGTSTYLLTLDETSLNDFLRRWFFPPGTINERYRNLQVDLRSGGLILYADVNLGLRWQRMGLLLLQDKGAETALTPAGVVLKEGLYTLPNNGPLTRALVPAQAYTQRAIDALTIVGPLPGEAHVVQTRFHADRLEILAQATYEAPPPPDTGWQLLEPGVELRELDVTVDPQRPTERLWVVRLDPARVRFRVRYTSTDPQAVSAWAARLQPLLVINAGYFTTEDNGDSETTGLLISEGRRWGTPFGDFAGMFAVTNDERVSVRWLRERPYDPTEPLIEAVQSFPVLVKPGGVMGFPVDADDGTPARRTVVAQDRGANILFIVAPRGYLSLHELAVFLAGSDLDVDTALNLDGGASTGLWLAAGEASVEIDSLTSVPSVIVAERR